MKTSLVVLVIVGLIAYTSLVLFEWKEYKPQQAFKESVYKANAKWCEKNKQWCKNKQ